MLLMMRLMCLQTPRGVRMMATGTVTTLAEVARFEEVIKKSRFIGLAARVTSAEEAVRAPIIIVRLTHCIVHCKMVRIHHARPNRTLSSSPIPT